MKPVLTTALLASLVALGCSSQKSDPLGEYANLSQDAVVAEKLEKNVKNYKAKTLDSYFTNGFTSPEFKTDNGEQRKEFTFSAVNGVDFDLELVAPNASNWLRLERKGSSDTFVLIANPSFTDLKGQKSRDVSVNFRVNVLDSTNSNLKAELSGYDLTVFAPGTKDAGSEVDKTAHIISLVENDTKPQFEIVAKSWGENSMRFNKNYSATLNIKVPGTHSASEPVVAIDSINYEGDVFADHPENDSDKVAWIRSISHISGDQWKVSLNINTTRLSIVEFDSNTERSHGKFSLKISASNISGSPVEVQSIDANIQFDGGQRIQWFANSKEISSSASTPFKMNAGQEEPVRMTFRVSSLHGMGTLSYGSGSSFTSDYSEILKTAISQFNTLMRDGYHVDGDYLKYVECINAPRVKNNAKFCTFEVQAQCAFVKNNGKFEIPSVIDPTIPVVGKISYNGGEVELNASKIIQVNNNTRACRAERDSKNANSDVSSTGGSGSGKLVQKAIYNGNMIGVGKKEYEI